MKRKASQELSNEGMTRKASQELSNEDTGGVAAEGEGRKVASSVTEIDPSGDLQMDLVVRTEPWVIPNYEYVDLTEDVATEDVSTEDVSAEEDGVALEDLASVDVRKVDVTPEGVASQ